MSEKAITLVPKNKIEEALLERADRILKIAPKGYPIERAFQIIARVCYQDPKLLACDLPSLVLASQNGIELGLDFAPASGQAYLVPFNCKVKGPDGRESWIKKAQLIIGYRGWKKLVLESNLVTALDAQVVYEGEKFEGELGDKPWIRHTPGFTSGRVIGAYAIARFADGHSQIDVLRDGDVDRARSMNKKEGGPWDTDFAAMVRKTAVRRICKYLPETPVIVKAYEYDEPEIVGDATPIPPRATGGLREALAPAALPEPPTEEPPPPSDDGAEFVRSLGMDS